jgi:hypothetical protein
VHSRLIELIKTLSHLASASRKRVVNDRIRAGDRKSRFIGLGAKMSVPFIDSIGFGKWDSPAVERSHHRARQIHPWLGDLSGNLVAISERDDVDQNDQPDRYNEISMNAHDRGSGPSAPPASQILSQPRAAH